MKQLWQNKAFRVLCWQMFNAWVAFLATTLTGIKGEMQVVIVWLAIPLLNLVTKWINTNYFWDLGVEKNLNNSDFYTFTKL